MEHPRASSYQYPDVSSQFDKDGKRIKRPMNAFMLFANEQRIEMRSENPFLCNKLLSVKLGEIWSGMKEEEKDTYFKQARELELLHKSQYPGYKYVPGASKIEKTMKKRGYDQSTFVENYKYLINRPVDNHPLRYSFAKPSNLPNPHLPTQFSGPRMRFNYGYRPKLDKKHQATVLDLLTRKRHLALAQRLAIPTLAHALTIGSLEVVRTRPA
ncbi:hypothetical protein ScPMuIL_012340 [Solemya velum]